jgi:outer membrane protein assembly factor BamD
LLLAFVLVGGTGLAAGCAGSTPESADEYFRTATDDFQYGALNPAIDKYRELLDQHPFSEHTEEAELKIAHAYYLLGDYTEAIVAFTDFQRRYPTSPHLPFVGYHLGMSYAKQMGTIDRDQTTSQSAHTYFVSVAQQYPQSPFAELARKELAHCRQNLAEHDLYVAEFYAKQGNHPAAQIRMLHVASEYGETTAAADGLLRLGKSYEKNRKPDRAALAYRALIELHPKSPQAVTARERLAALPENESDSGADPLETLLAAHGRMTAPASGSFGARRTAQRGPANRRSAPPANVPGANIWGGLPY